jgi:hypothetical protein
MFTIRPEGLYQDDQVVLSRDSLPPAIAERVIANVVRTLAGNGYKVSNDRSPVCCICGKPANGSQAKYCREHQCQRRKEMNDAHYRRTGGRR